MAPMTPGERAGTLVRRPWRLGGIGLVLIAVDFRTTALDLLPDAIGWALVAFAVACVLGWRLATVAGAVAAASLATLALPYHYIEYNPLTGARVTVTADTDLGYAKFLEYDALHGLRLWSALAAAVLGSVLIWHVVRRLEQRADARGAAGAARQLRVLRWSVVALWAVPQVAGMIAAVVSAGGYDPVWNDPASHLSLVGTLALGALGLRILTEAREPWALPPRPTHPAPAARHSGPGR